jgi:hypothetical protein
LLQSYQGMLQSLQQTPIAQLKTKLDIWRPDILLMCDQLVLFANLWSYVRRFDLVSHFVSQRLTISIRFQIRSQAVQFRSIIQGGLGAATNTVRLKFKDNERSFIAYCTSQGFKMQIKLARDVCEPLQDGLRKYKAHLASWA